PDVQIPAYTVQLLWKHTDGLSDEESIWLLKRLEHKGLLSLENVGANLSISMHDLQYDYLRVVMKQALPTLHRNLVDAYRKICLGSWHKGPDDGYFFQYLSYHLY